MTMGCEALDAAICGYAAQVELLTRRKLILIEMLNRKEEPTTG